MSDEARARVEARRSPQEAPKPVDVLGTVNARERVIAGSVTWVAKEWRDDLAELLAGYRRELRGVWERLAKHEQ